MPVKGYYNSDKAPVDERIGCLNIVKKWYKNFEYVVVKSQNNYLWVVILSVECAVVGGIFCYL